MEKKKLLQRDELPVQYDSTTDSNRRNNSTRSQGKNRPTLTTSSSLGAFRFLPPTDIIGLPRSYSVNADGMSSAMTPVEMGRQELYTHVPFTAVFGLQKKEHDVSQAFASYAGELNAEKHPEWSVRRKATMSDKASQLILDEIEFFDTHVVTTPLIFAIVVATASQFLVGYNTSVMNAVEKVVFAGHSTAVWSLAVAAFAVGGPFGAIVGGRLADSRGRRGALLIDTWTFLLGGLVQASAHNIHAIVLARFIIGFASGFSSVLVPIYLGELAPPNLRGTLGTLTQFAMVIGILIANLFSFPCANEDGWRRLFGITSIVAAMQLLCSPFLLESPRWLLNRNPKSYQARYIIKQLRGMRYDHEVEHEIGNYIIGEAAQHQDETSSSAIILEMLSHKKIRLLLFSCLFLQMCQQFSGINAVFYYSTSFFEGVIDNPLVGTTIVSGLNVVATYISLLLMDSCGRRTLILWSSGGMFLSCIGIVFSLLGFIKNDFALIAVNSYVFFFEIGLGPIPWLIVAEMFEGKYVATAMSLCCQLNWACNFMIGLIFPTMNEYLGPYSFGPFACILAGAFFFALFVLPETQGTTPEDLIAEMASHNVTYDTKTIEDPSRINLEWCQTMKALAEGDEEKMADKTYDYGFILTDSERRDELMIEVTKESEESRLGVAVVVRSGQLFVSDIDPDGLFANTDLEVNDLVVSINGVCFRNNPCAQQALALVSNSKGPIVFVVRKLGPPLEI